MTTAPLAEREPKYSPNEPGSEVFWKTYNQNLELPIAVLMAGFLHVLIVAGLILGMWFIGRSTPDKESVPIALVDNGEDDNGKGNPNNGGVEDPLTKGDVSPIAADFQALPLPDNVTLPEIQQEIQDRLELDKDLATVKITEEKAAAYAGLDQTIRDKLLPVGQKKGTGAGPAGPGGTGSDATRARSLRWVMRFKTSSGRDYLDQLAGLGAIVVVPIPPDNKSAYVFRELSNPKPGEVVSEAEWHRLAQQIQFCDFKQDSVRQVSGELGLASVKPHMFWAFFPKSLEDRLAKLEREYQNRSADAIEETVFQVTMTNGRYELVVVRQTLKK